MLKNSYLILVSCFVIASCKAADPFKGLTPEAAQAVVNVMESAQNASSSNALLPAEPKSWWDSINGAISTIGSSLTKESIDKAENLVHDAKGIVNDSIVKINTEVMPVLRQNLHEGLIEGETALKAVVDHTTEAAIHAVDYTGTALKDNLNDSISHASRELTLNVIPAAREGLQATVAQTSSELTTQVIPAAKTGLQEVATHSATEFKAVLKSSIVAVCFTFAAFFGAKIAFDGVNEYLDKDGKDKTKPMIKIGLGSACFVGAIYAVCKQFE